MFTPVLLEELKEELSRLENIASKYDSGETTPKSIGTSNGIHLTVRQLRIWIKGVERSVVDNPAN